MKIRSFVLSFILFFVLAFGISPFAYAQENEESTDETVEEYSVSEKSQTEQDPMSEENIEPSDPISEDQDPMDPGEVNDRTEEEQDPDGSDNDGGNPSAASDMPEQSGEYGSEAVPNNNSAETSPDAENTTSDPEQQPGDESKPQTDDSNSGGSEEGAPSEQKEPDTGEQGGLTEGNQDASGEKDEANQEETEEASDQQNDPELTTDSDPVRTDEDVDQDDSQGIDVADEEKEEESTHEALNDTDDDAETDGWHTDENGERYYVENGSRLCSQIRLIEGKYYLFSADGIAEEKEVVQRGVSNIAPGNRIWFYNISGDGAFSADFIVVESNGRWGLIDSGHRFADTIVDEDGTVYYVPQVNDDGTYAGLSCQIQGKNGKDAAIYLIQTLGISHIDFVIGTHAHSDHIGGIPEIASLLLQDYDGTAKFLFDENSAYICKQYRHVSAIDDDLEEKDPGSWHNQAYAYQARKALAERGAAVIDLSNGVVTGDGNEGNYDYEEILNKLNSISSISGSIYNAGDLSDFFDDYISFTFSQLNMRLYNLFSVNNPMNENVNSIVTMIDNGNQAAYLGGDIDAEYRVEQRVAQAIEKDYGKVELVKASHHGATAGSNTKELIDLFQPAYMVACRQRASTVSDLPVGAYSCAEYYAKNTYGTTFYEVGASDHALAFSFTNNCFAISDLKGNGDQAEMVSADFCISQAKPEDGWYRWNVEYRTGNQDQDYYYFVNGRAKTGWFEENDKEYYFDANGFLKQGLQTVGGKTYYFTPQKVSGAHEGSMTTGWQNVDGADYLFGPTGEMLTSLKSGTRPVGWNQFNGNWYYLDEKSDIKTNWITVDGKSYYLGNDGIRQTGWKTLSGKKYYLNDSSGVMQTGWMKSSGNWYYFNNTGVMQTAWQKVDGKWYYFNNSGVMQTGWKTFSGDRYYLNDNGMMQTAWKKIDNDWYYFNSSGVLQTGCQKIGGVGYVFLTDGRMLSEYEGSSAPSGWFQADGKYYFIKNGTVQTGWLKNASKWYYLNSNGVMQTQWEKVAGKWYYLGKDGAMRIGWQKLSGKWYYLDPNGAMQTGWLKQNGNNYYFNSSGVMQVGWLKQGGNWYYLNKSGVMQKNWQLIDDTSYYFDTQGVMQTGWKKLDDNWYYFNASGAKQTEWKKIDGKWYYFGDDGIMRKGWVLIKSDYYWFDSNGVMAVSSTKTINGKSYTFDANGRWVNRF